MMRVQEGGMKRLPLQEYLKYTPKEGKCFKCGNHYLKKAPNTKYCQPCRGSSSRYSNLMGDFEYLAIKGKIRPKSYKRLNIPDEVTQAGAEGIYRLCYGVLSLSEHDAFAPLSTIHPDKNIARIIQEDSQKFILGEGTEKDKVWFEFLCEIFQHSCEKIRKYLRSRLKEKT